MGEARSPLEGIRVIEFTTAWAGPVCGMILSDMGAEVIKIENPALPDVSRRVGPFAEEEKGLNRAGYFATFNRGKKDCLLDLKSSAGLEAAKRLIKISDAVITNFAPRVMGSVGLDYPVLKEIKPDMIMICLSGYGATGPQRDNVAYGEVLEAYSGLASLIGYPGGPPHQCGTTICDHNAATLAAFAVLAALHHRNLTGEGQYIELAESEALLNSLPEAIMEYTMNGSIPQARGNRDEAVAPHNCYRCQGEDEWVAIAIESDEEWKNFCLAMGKPELIADERFQDGFLRWKNQDELDRIISEWTGKQKHVNVMKLLQEAHVAAAPVYTGEELYKDPHLRERKFFVEINHPEVGKRELPGIIAKLSETPGAIRSHDPLFGEHTEWLLNELLGTEPKV